MKTGLLTLIPTPLSSDDPLEPVAQESILRALTENPEKTRIVVESPKEARRRWLKWGLPRETIPDFVLYNEHTAKEVSEKLYQDLKQGFKVFLLSDEGLPAFCDPGRLLVDRCHRAGIRVTATPFPHSIGLAVALSGFPDSTFVFQGFLPREEGARRKALDNVVKEKRMQILMDTPYRLQKLLAELQGGLLEKRLAFLGLDLNLPTETLLRGTLSQINEGLKNQEKKREFVLILAPQGFI